MLNVLCLLPLAQAKWQLEFFPALRNITLAFITPPSLSLYPLTNGNTTVRIPDLDDAWSLFFRYPTFVKESLTNSAISLLNEKVSLGPHAQALRDIDLILGFKPPGEESFTLPPILKIPLTDTYVDLIKNPKLSREWATLSGLSYWAWPAMIIAVAGRCRCSPATIYSPYISILDNLFQRPWLTLDGGVGHSNISSDGDGCSPRSLAHGNIVRTYGTWSLISEESKPALRFPAIQDIVKAQFDLIVNVLRNETAMPILESIRIQHRSQNATDELVERIVRVIGLPMDAASNMRGFLTIRQYALYQLLKRGDSDWSS